MFFFFSKPFPVEAVLDLEALLAASGSGLTRKVEPSYAKRPHTIVNLIGYAMSITVDDNRMNR